MSDFEERARKAAEAVRREVDSAVPSEEKNLKRAKRSQVRAAGVTSLALVALVGASLFVLPDGSANKTADNSNSFQLAGSLKSFDACDDALQYFKDKAPQYFIDNAGNNRVYSTMEMAPNVAGATADAAAPQAAAGKVAGSDYSTTNVQEAGVDEPDIIKTNGDVVIAVASGKVFVLSDNNGHPVIKATISDSAATNVFLSGNHLVVFSGANSPSGIDPMYDMPYRPTYGGQSSTVTLYDISDPTKPQKLSSMKIDGTILDARLVDGQMRVATASSPDPDIASPQWDNNGQLTQESKDSLSADINKTTIDEWLPQYTITNSSGKNVASGRLVSCDQVAHPQTFSGVDTVALSTFDINGSSLDGFKSVGVVAGGQKLYATADNTYITSTEWSKDGSASKTDIHEFNTSKSGASTYKGSGTVTGTLINQYSMSEYNGVFRVATTVSGTRGWLNPRFRSEGMVTTFKLEDKALRQVGQVGGLGEEDNESVTAVRFVDDLAYVSTARQTDPLFVVDLSKPETPTVSGKLEIPGSSSYLHPLKDKLVLGVGQDGTGKLQFSLFDVSNPSDPKRVGTLTYGSGTAPATSDPKAFLYWMPRDLVIAPASIYSGSSSSVESYAPGSTGTGSAGSSSSSSGGDAAPPSASAPSSAKGLAIKPDYFSGLILMKADGKTLNEIGRLADVGSDGSYVNRSIVIGNNVYLLSYSDLQVNSLDTHAKVAAVNLD